MAAPLLLILAAVLGIVAIGGVALAFAGGGPTKTQKRTQAIAERSRTHSRARTAAPDPTARRRQILKSLRDQERRQRKASVSLAGRLQQAGLNIPMRAFWIASGVLGLLIFGVLVFLGQKPLIGFGFGLGAGLGLPQWTVGFLAKRRAKRFVAGFPDAADIIVRGVKSGLPVHECLQIIAKEAPEPLSSEFRRLVDGVAHGMSLDQALEKMYERMPLAELRFFTIVLGIQQKTGGNLAEALGNLSTVLRARRMMREKVKALTSEATASACIIGSLPPVVVVLISITQPSYLTVLFHDPKGEMMLAAAGVWMAIGIFIMNRMVNFKI